MTEQERFYLERDRRTRECGVSDIFDVPVGVVVGADAAGSANGQAAVLALVNMLARIHRRLWLDIPSVALIRPSLVSADRMDEAARVLARTVDPYIQLDAASSCGHAIGLGADAPLGLPWYVGAEGQMAIIDRQPVRFGRGDRLSLGGGLAACLAAAAMLRQVVGHAQRPVRLSAWNFQEGDQAEYGPDLGGPIDVGNVLQVGAGGVSSCLAYWLREYGVIGSWHVLDGDYAVLHNTNRSLGLFPQDAGWPNGQPRNKAIAVAELFGGTASPLWYDEFDHDSFKPDLVLPLANQRSVRYLVGSRGEPVILHATTSRTWEAQLHRHVPNRDDCITCRMPNPGSQVEFSCGTVQLAAPGESSNDAALPFLTATAALLLVSGLYQLQHGQLTNGQHNLWAVCFRDMRRQTRRAIHTCREGCTVTLPAQVRRRIHIGRRWSSVDNVACGP